MDIIQHYVDQFNARDEEIYKNAIDNAHAADWMREEIPVFECPDKEMERTYYFRWWTMRKHLKMTEHGWVFTEFLPKVPWSGMHNTINAAVGHHIYEARWLKNGQKYLSDYINFFLTKSDRSHHYSAWLIDAALQLSRCKETPALAEREKLLDARCVTLIGEGSAESLRFLLPEEAHWQTKAAGVLIGGGFAFAVMAGAADADPYGGRFYRAYRAALAACLRLRLLGARGKFAEAAAALPGLRGKAPDSDLLRALRDVFSAARAAGDDAGLDAVAAAGALDPAFAGASGIRLASAREWLGVPFRGEGGPALYAQRFDRLLSLDFPPSQLQGLWTRYFYDVLGDLDALRAVAASGRELKKRLSDDADRETMRVYELDADFLLGDYDACAALLDEGIPDHDAAWHEMMKVKVLAHKAEAAGDWAAAAAGYAKFVSLLPDEDQQDPTSGIVYSRSTLVGNNQRRIAGLWEKAGKPDKASAALVAARKAYRKALEGNAAGKETADYIEAQLKALDEEQGKQP